MVHSLVGPRGGICKTSLAHAVTAAAAAQSIMPAAWIDQGSLIEASLILSALAGQLPAVYGG